MSFNTATEFKTRWRNHQMSFKHESKRNDTELSKHLWRLKDEKKDFAISWKILTKAKSYSNLTKRCNLCNTEKFYILYKPDMATLNRRNELVSTCRHRRQFLLKFNRILCYLQTTSFIILIKDFPFNFVLLFLPNKFKN